MLTQGLNRTWKSSRMTRATDQCVRNAFDAEADQYFDSRQTSNSFRAQRDILLRWLAPHPGPILELGCGSGDMLVSLMAADKPVTGVDLSGEMLMRAARRLRDAAHVDLLQADTRCLPFPEQAYNVVVTMGVIEYVPDPMQMLREIARVLRPGGVLALTLPHSQCAARNWGVAMKSFSKTIRGREGEADQVTIRRYQADEFDRFLEPCGLRRIDSAFCGVRMLPWPLTDYWPGLTAKCNAICERFKVLSRRRRLAGVYCVFCERL